MSQSSIQQSGTDDRQQPGVGAGRPEVSVVVPAHNAERTLAWTLDAVLAQDFAPFEVLVVDDGSTDATLAIAQRYAATDERVRVVEKPWSGVADTRNLGIRLASAPLVAPIDADDVWHPSFLRKMHRAICEAGEDTVFAYANFRRIDTAGMVLGNAPSYDISGWAFHRFLTKNLVGNGSGIMFRRDAALAVGGYEPRLQCEHDAPGCEDWLLQMRLAARGRVVAVSQYLVGYRKVDGAMSEDRARLNRSRIHAFRILFGEVECPDARAVRWALGRSQAECAFYELSAGNLRNGCRLLPQALWRDPWGTADAFAYGLGATLRALVRRVVRRRRPASQQRFADLDPDSDPKPIRRDLIGRRLELMAALDRQQPPTPTVVAPLADPASG